MDKIKIWISTGEALDLIEKEIKRKITLPTLINWVEKYEIGHKLAGRWEIDKTALIGFLRENRNG